MGSEILPNKLPENSGVDIGDVTVNNAGGASAVNIQDGGNSITVDASDLDIRPLSYTTDSVNIGAQQDIFGHIAVVQPYNQVELRLDDSGWLSYVDRVTVSTGSVTQASGLVTAATGTGATGSAEMLSKDAIEYRPGIGVFGAGTAVFTTGVANSVQRVGLSDNSTFDNSVTFGYEGATFGILYRRGGAQVAFVPQTAWDDPCDGVAVNSRFTRNGVKETLDPTKGNLYRVLAGLFGFAGFVCQVWSPDNGWIDVYTYNHINADTVPVFNTNTLKVIVAATKTSGSGNITIKSQCWAGGTGSVLERLGSTLTDRKLTQTVRSVLAAKMPSGAYTNIDATAGGNLKVSIEEIDGAAVMPVTGTVTANAGTGTFVIGDGGGSISVDDNGGSLTVDGTVTANAGTGTFAISAASLPLPTGAATEAKQPALGTAGSASTDVITVQGISSMTALKVDGSAVTQPVSGTITANAGTGTFAVSAASLPLPSGAATSANQATTNSTLSSIDAGIPAGLGQATMSASMPVTIASDQSSIGVTGTFWQTTQPVSATSLPLPTGAATAAKQPALGSAGTASSDVITVQGITSMTPLIVDGSASTQPVSGTVTANAGTGTFAVSAAALPLPTGAATSANQTTANASLASIDAGIPASLGQTTKSASMPVTIASDQGAIDVNIASGSVTISSEVEVKNDVGNPVPVSATALPLPSGAATAAKQPALGTAGTASTDVITVQGIASMTALKVDGSAVTQPVSDGGGSLTVDGTVTANAGTGTFVVGDGGGSLTVDGTVAATQSGTWSVGLSTGSNTVGKVLITDGTDDATIRDVTGAKALDVSIVDASGNQITSFGGGTQYTEGDTDATITGTAMLWEDTSNTLSTISAASPLPIGDAGGSITVDDGGNSITVDGTVTANAGTGTFVVGDGGGSLTVDGSVSATQSGSWTVGINAGSNTIGKVAITDGTDDATIRDVTGAKALDVSIVDASGNQITSFGSGVQYTEGDTDATITGTAVLWEDGSDTLRPVSAAHPLPISDGGSSLTVDGTVTANAGTGTFVVGDGGGSLTVDGTVTANAGTGTFAVSAASLPLPAGAATSAKQPALGAAGTASADVITVQGISGMTAIKVDGSAVTQPVSDGGGSLTIDGTVTANAGSGTFVVGDGGNSLSIDDNGGSITVDGSVGLSTGSNTVGKVYLTDGTDDVTIRDVTGAKALDVSIVDASGNQITSFSGGVQYTEGDTDATITGTAILWEDTSDTLRAVSASNPLPISDGGNSITVDGTVTANAGTGTFAVSASSLPLPTGAATAAKQPALGTAGSPSTDVITVQGATSMTALKVDGSAVTQPISGSITANAGTGTFVVGDGGGSLTVDGTVAATQSGSWSVGLNAGSNNIGKVQLTDGIDDVTIRDVTGAKSLDVSIVDGSGNQITSFGGGTQYTEGDTDATITGTAIMWEDGSDTLRSVSATNPLPISDAGSSITIDDGGNSITVDGSVTANAGTGTFVVGDGGGSLTVDGTVTANAGTGTFVVGDGGGSLTVDGTVTANAGTGTFAVSATSLPLPTGAATSAKQPALGTAGSASTDVITVQGIASMTALKVDGSAVTQPVSDGGGSLTVDGTVTANAGTGTFIVGDGGSSISIDDNGSSITVDGTVTANAGTGTFVVGDGGSSISVDDNGGSLTVDGSVTAIEEKAATSSLSNVSTSTASAQLLASNSSRLGATIWNDATSALYVKFGTTASATSCTVKIAADGYFEVPFDYTGRIDGILASGTGTARVTEVTA